MDYLSRFDEKPPVAFPWKRESWDDRVKAFLDTPEDAARFDWPFPMGVFGTLRQYQGNNPRMHNGKVAHHRAAFLPHFQAAGLSISFVPNASAPFEVFYYDPEAWVKMIPSVDRLEGFLPRQHINGKHENGYYRTLAWLRLLPEGYEDKWFPKNEPGEIGGRRDMRIPPEAWADYEAVPCWIYSNLYSNSLVAKEQASPVIWPTGANEKRF